MSGRPASIAGRARDLPPAENRLQRLLRVSDVCAAWKVGKSTVYELHAAGRLPGYRIGGALRFDADEVRRFLDSCREGD